MQDACQELAGALRPLGFAHRRSCTFVSEPPPRWTEGRAEGEARSRSAPVGDPPIDPSTSLTPSRCPSGRAGFGRSGSVPYPKAWGGLRSTSSRCCSGREVAHF